MDIFLNITNRCNLSCSHCFVKNLNSRNHISDMSFQNIDRIFSELEKIKDNLNIIFYGGEPLLREKEFFKYILKNYKRDHINYHIVTNLINYNENYDHIIENLFNSNISASFDATREIRGSHEEFIFIWYNRYKRIKDKFNVNIRLITTKKFLQNTPLYWFTIINFLDPSSYYFNHYLTNDNNDELKTDYKEYIDFVIKFSKIALSYKNPIPFYPLNNTINFLTNGKNTFFPLSGNCIEKQLTIQPNGDVGFCQYLTENGVIFGNIYREDILKILSSKERILLHMSLDSKDCFDCQYYGEVCFGGCIAEKYLSGNKDKSFKSYTDGYCIKYFDFVKNIC